MESRFFCMNMNLKDGSTCLHEQEAEGDCERCGSDRMFPIRLMGLKMSMDMALSAAFATPDDPIPAMKRINEAFENVLYELKRIGDRLDKLEGSQSSE